MSAHWRGRAASAAVLEKETPGSVLGIHAWQKVFVTANENCLYYFRDADNYTDTSTGTFITVLY